MSVTEETSKIKYACEFCNREFLRESTVLKHICQYKHRWLDRDKRGNRLGFQAWIEFYKKHSASKKQKTYEEFIRSPYYGAFVKFGLYCTEVNVLNVSRYVDWLLENQIKLDTWAQDTNYNKYLTQYLRVEDPFDAIARSVETSIDFAEREGIQSKDMLRYANKNRLCHAITTGKISPWMLYQSQSGLEFLEQLDATQQSMIIDYINPELWAIKFSKSSAEVKQIKEILSIGGY